jgi:lysozyme
MEQMRCNQEGIDLIKSFEGCELIAYYCSAGVVTVGYGHTGPEVKPGLRWTKEKAEEVLKSDLRKFEMAIRELVKVPLNENEFSALVSLCFNIGPLAFAKSTLLRLLNLKQKTLAAEEFSRWNKVGGKIVPGLAPRLSRRREAEKALFLKPLAI